jgi:hypothetical protein
MEARRACRFLDREEFSVHTTESLHDHGSGSGEAWQNKSEGPRLVGQASRLIIEWTADL